MANQKISDIYTASSKSSLDGTEQVEINDGGTSKGTLTSNIAALARNISGTDYDISTGNETADISTLTALGAGTIRRYSWSGGDGTYTFSFTGTAGITIDGIASSEYIGEGVGHLDLFVTSSSACITINRGEVWDNDGGGFGDATWEKGLCGMLAESNWTYVVGNGTANIGSIAKAMSVQPSSVATVFGNFPGDVSTATTPSVLTDFNNEDGNEADVIVRIVDTAGTLSFSIKLNKKSGTTFSSGTNFGYCWGHKGRWTDSYPKVT